MNQHLEIFNHEADSFFRVSLRTLYETLMEFMEERGGPTPQHIIQALPTSKVTLAQIASNTTCPICFGEYIQDENLINLPCNHSYHQTCITSWLKLKSTCPTCRLDIAKDAPSRIEENIEAVDLSHLDNLLESENEADDNDEQASETTSQASDINSTDSAQQRLRAFSSTSSSSRLTSSHGPLSSNSSLSSTNTRVDLTETRSNGNETRRHGIFSRSSSPIVIDSSSEDNVSPFTSKVSIVQNTNRVLNNELSTSQQVSSTSFQQNKRQTTTVNNSEVPAKRKSRRETEIW